MENVASYPDEGQVETQALDVRPPEKQQGEDEDKDIHECVWKLVLIALLIRQYHVMVLNYLNMLEEAGVVERVKVLVTGNKKGLFEEYQIQYIISEDVLPSRDVVAMVEEGMYRAPVNVAMDTNNSPVGIHRETVAFLPPDVPEGNHLSADSGACAGTTNVTTGNMADSPTVIPTRGGTNPTPVVDTYPVTQEMSATNSEQTPPTSPPKPPVQCVENSSWGVTYDIKTFEYHADNWEFPWDVYATPIAEHPSNIISPTLHCPSLNTGQDSTQQLGPLPRVALQIPPYMKSHVERDKDRDHEIVSPVEESGSHFLCLHHDFIHPIAGEVPRDIIPLVNHPPLPLGQPLNDSLSDQEVYIQPVEDSGSQFSTSAVFPAPPWH